MKKQLTLILVLGLLPVMAAQHGMHEPGTGLEDNMTPMARQTGSVSPEPISAPAPVRAQVTEKARDPAELREMVQTRQRQLEAEADSIAPVRNGAARMQVLRNQNRVREAVHAFLAMEDLAGGIGPQVSELAREFNNSVQTTIRAEERIQNRGMLTRLFFGGDVEAARQLQQEAEQNRQRIQELQQLRDQCDCDNQTRQVMAEQIQALVGEQQRLRELAQNETGNRGIFGWFSR